MSKQQQTEKQNTSLANHPIQKVVQDAADKGEYAIFSILLPLDNSDASVSRVLPYSPTEEKPLTEEEESKNMVLVIAMAEIAMQWLPVRELIAMKESRKEKPVSESEDTSEAA